MYICVYTHISTEMCAIFLYIESPRQYIGHQRQTTSSKMWFCCDCEASSWERTAIWSCNELLSCVSSDLSASICASMEVFVAAVELTHTHTRPHTHTHTNTHTHTHTHSHSVPGSEHWSEHGSEHLHCRSICRHTNNTHTHTLTQTHTPTHTQHTPTPRPTHKHTHSHPHPHPNTDTPTHIDLSICIDLNICELIWALIRT